MRYMSDTVICFDLDDTLYKEIDFLISAYGEIATRVGYPEVAQQMVEWYINGKNAFEELIRTYGLKQTITDCLKIYKNHFPHISLEDRVMEFLEDLKNSGAIMCVITDGKSITQRNKIKALGIEKLLDCIIISEEIGSEKPAIRNYTIVMERFPYRKYFIYVGDNPTKDFSAPIQLGWKCYCLKGDERNIHQQDLNIIDHNKIKVISSIREII